MNYQKKMNDKQVEFERKYFHEVRNSFRKAIELADENNLRGGLEKLILDKKYVELINKVQLLYDFTINSQFLENIKLNWWESFLTGNLHVTPTKKIALTDFEGNLIEFDSIQKVYEQFIKNKNETIWKPHENIFTKIFTEWIVESVIDVCNQLTIKERIDFINKSVQLINKQQAFEEYTKYQLNEHLNYYKTILELTLKDIAIAKFVYEDGKIFSNLIENDKIKRLKQSLSEEKFDDFFKLASTIYASVPYQIYSNKEASFHSIFHVLAHLITNNSRSEESTNTGRIDTIIELDSKIFLFEFKLNDANKAIQQIKEKNYHQKYLDRNKVIFLIGVSFSLKKRNINDWRVEKI